MRRREDERMREGGRRKEAGNSRWRV